MGRPHTESSIMKSISPYLQHSLFSPVLSRIRSSWFWLQVLMETKEFLFVSWKGDRDKITAFRKWLGHVPGVLTVHEPCSSGGPPEVAELRLSRSCSLPGKCLCLSMATVKHKLLPQKKFHIILFRRLGSFPCDHKLSFMFQMFTLHPK